MTDETTEHAESEAFNVVPSAEYVLSLERRIAALEGKGAPQQLDQGIEAKILTTLETHDARLGRHRDELERIKSNLNDMGEYVKRSIPAAAPASEGSPL